MKSQRDRFYLNKTAAHFVVESLSMLCNHTYLHIYIDIYVYTKGSIILKPTRRLVLVGGAPETFNSPK